MFALTVKSFPARTGKLQGQTIYNCGENMSRKNDLVPVTPEINKTMEKWGYSWLSSAALS
jgi:hypothetical protein